MFPLAIGATVIRGEMGFILAKLQDVPKHSTSFGKVRELSYLMSLSKNPEIRQ